MNQQQLLTKLNNDVNVRKKQIELMQVSLGVSEQLDLTYFNSLLTIAEEKFAEIAALDDDAFLIWKLNN